MINFCTINVGSLVERGRKVVAVLARRRVDVCCLQKVKYRNQGWTTIGSNEEKYKL